MSRTADPTAKISLLRAAEEIFAEKGLPAAKVEEITRRAHLSKGAFYLHFQSKEEAFKQVVESFLARFGAHFQGPASLDADADAKALLALWFEMDVQIFEFLWQNRAIMRILQGCQNELSYLLDAFHETIRGVTQEWLRYGKARALFRRDIDEDLASTLICGAYHELTRRMLREPKRPPIEAWLTTTQHFFARALGTPALTSTFSENPSVNQHIGAGEARPRRASSR